MSCDQIEELLSDLLADELPQGARAGVEAHLASCERCAESYRALKRTVRFVRANASVRARARHARRRLRRFTRALADDARPRSDEVLVSGIAIHA